MQPAAQSKCRCPVSLLVSCRKRCATRMGVDDRDLPPTMSQAGSGFKPGPIPYRKKLAASRECLVLRCTARSRTQRLLQSRAKPCPSPCRSYWLSRVATARSRMCKCTGICCSMQPPKALCPCSGWARWADSKLSLFWRLQRFLQL